MVLTFGELGMFQFGAAVNLRKGGEKNRPIKSKKGREENLGRSVKSAVNK